MTRGLYHHKNAFSLARAVRQEGAALLTAMLTVTLVTTLVSAALWQNLKQVEIAIAQKGYVQSAWIMTGVLDWLRSLIHEDGISAQGAAVDHLDEAWALPVQEVELSTFLSHDKQWAEVNSEVFVSWQITDAQSRLNVMNLIEEGEVSAEALAAFTALFEQFNLPLTELKSLTDQLSTAQHIEDAKFINWQGSPSRSLIPQYTEQLVWLGLSTATLAALQAYITVLPEPTPVNLNTATAEILSASVPGLEMAMARQALVLRERQHWTSLNAAQEVLVTAGQQLEEKQHSVYSRYFEVVVSIRIDKVVRQERALIRRDGNQVRMLWRIQNPVITHLH